MKHIALKALALVPVLSIVGCVGAINMKNADRYYDAALQSEWAGDFEHSKEMYYRSFVNARSGSASTEYISATLYGYGRMLGYTCDYTASNEALKESLELEKSISDTVTSNITKRLSELGRLNLARESYAEAAAYFGEASPELERLGMLKSDPVGYALYLEDYAKALAQSGQTKQSDSILLKAKNIRNSNADVTAKFTPIYYEDVCKNKEKS